MSKACSEAAWTTPSGRKPIASLVSDLKGLGSDYIVTLSTADAPDPNDLINAFVYF